VNVRSSVTLPTPTTPVEPTPTGLEETPTYPLGNGYA